MLFVEGLDHRVHQFRRLANEVATTTAGQKYSIAWSAGSFGEPTMESGLPFFVLENPDGIIKRKKNESESLADRIQTLLKAELPRAWHMYVQRLNLTESGLPAQRPRVFIIGVSPQMRITFLQRRLQDRPVQTVQPVPISEILCPVTSLADWDTLTYNQQTNVFIFLKQFHDELKDF